MRRLNEGECLVGEGGGHRDDAGDGEHGKAAVLYLGHLLGELSELSEWVSCNDKMTGRICERMYERRGRVGEGW